MTDTNFLTTRLCRTASTMMRNQAQAMQFANRGGQATFTGISNSRMRSSHFANKKRRATRRLISLPEGNAEQIALGGIDRSLARLNIIGIMSLAYRSDTQFRRRSAENIG